MGDTVADVLTAAFGDVAPAGGGATTVGDIADSSKVGARHAHACRNEVPKLAAVPGA
ncbi:hypothetical protein GCM10011581_22310 [Saccharopolyspora subtropica]|uniref:Uncharacterized protein n=1 Tax=Saccharopolyspora thermophila TaxID=89367 RepID=A0A917NB54_9PSEU|nr:hypothetical protein GCM10011581_22310 [Saccharopolyspora subtropica]